MHARLSLSSSVEATSRFAVNASKRPCRKPAVRGVVENHSARTVSWAARPLAVGSRPVLLARRDKTTRGLRANQRSTRARGPSHFAPRWLASSTRCAFELPVLLVHAPPSKLGPMKTVPSFQAEKSMRGLLSAHVVTLVIGTAQASNPSIERTCQRPLRALWPAAHVER